MRRILMFASSVLLVPAFAMAQHAGGGMAAGHFAAPSAHMMAAAPTRTGGVRVSAGAQRTIAPVVRRIRVVSPTGTPVNRGATIVISSPVFSPFYPNVPGLGFDYAHLAAVNPIRPFSHRFGIGTGLGYGGGFLFPYGGVIYEEAPPVEQPVVEEVAAENPNDANRARAAEAREFPEASEPPAPQHEAPEYVFVRRDGGLLFAVAYSWDNGVLHYITREGLRGSVTQSALDMEATQQFNDQRGVNFRSPA